MLAVTIIICIVLFTGNTGPDADGRAWTWIDVVSTWTETEAGRLERAFPDMPADLRNIVCQTAPHRLQIHPASRRELPSQIDNRLEHHTATPRLLGGIAEPSAAGHRQCATSRLVGVDRESCKVRAGEHQSAV